MWVLFSWYGRVYTSNYARWCLSVLFAICVCLPHSRHFPCCKTWWIKSLNLNLKTMCCLPEEMGCCGWRVLLPAFPKESVCSFPRCQGAWLLISPLSRSLSAHFPVVKESHCSLPRCQGVSLLISPLSRSLTAHFPVVKESHCSFPQYRSEQGSLHCDLHGASQSCYFTASSCM